MNFSTFKTAVAKQFKQMSASNLFRVSVEGNVLWDTYIKSFPEGSNPIFRERTDHDCSCCKQFIRNVGNVVTIKDGVISSIWDVTMPSEPEYQVVADALSALVKAQAIKEPFLHYENQVGTDKNFEQMVDHTQTWEHFHVMLPKSVVVPKQTIATQIGKSSSLHGVILRSVQEITQDSIDTVLELIAQNSIYRGAEHLQAVKKFAKFANGVRGKANVSDLCWEAYDPAFAIRNTVIGTLLTDLSEGVDLEHAVKSFEAKVAPTNYKRPTALVTQKMVDQAKAKVDELGLTSSLGRRHASLADISVNNIIYVDRDARKVMQDANPFAGIASTATAPKQFNKVEEVSIAKFIADILPTAKTVEVMVENKHSGNFVSLLAPTDPTAGQLFKWPNGFSWDYVGGVADSMKERVKKAGGSVEGDLCCRLAWDYTDDLDFHMKEPGNSKIFFGSYRRSNSPNGGQLDLDSNGCDGMRDEPVENIFYANKSKMMKGKYILSVYNYSGMRGGKSGEGFEVEIECDNQTYSLNFSNSVRVGAYVTVAEIHWDGVSFKVTPKIDGSATSKDIWGISTNNFQRVTTIMHSPNHWDDQGIGNKHYFFMLDGCKNDGAARGFYNEFLDGRLEPHRKVFEMVGGKMVVPQSDQQLSGIGFSETQRNTLICKVTGSTTRVIKINF